MVCEFFQNFHGNLRIVKLDVTPSDIREGLESGFNEIVSRVSKYREIEDQHQILCYIHPAEQWDWRVADLRGK